jgi:hypothetical protein
MDLFDIVIHPLQIIFVHPEAMWRNQMERARVNNLAVLPFDLKLQSGFSVSDFLSAELKITDSM